MKICPVDGVPCHALNCNICEGNCYREYARWKEEQSMKPHQERVIAEKADLDEKLAKLNEFGKSEMFQTLPPEEQERLERQSRIMDQYSVVLSERIAAFTKENEK